LRQFERLLEEDDPVIDDWITGRQFVPKEHDNNVVALLRRFCLVVSA
jgi:succinate dehydrogenase flavin-adding protein (antitoxin of CptAB toxin-antitoxin module)